MTELVKVVGLSLNKTGTTTLGRCLEILLQDRHVGCRGKLLRAYRQGKVAPPR